MYYPYLRGKLYELISIRELSSGGNLDNVIPIVEPVQDNYSALNKAINVLTENNDDHILIVKPNVGNLNTIDSWRELIQGISITTNTIPGFIIDENQDARINDLVQEILPERVALIHFSSINSVEDVINDFQGEIFNILNLDRVGPFYKRNFPDLNNILLRDPFSSEKRNSDYLNVLEQEFSNDHRFYSDEGYSGYGDFSTIGSNYSDGGFAPYAVAIHLSFLNEFENCRIKHFVSDSNMDQSNTPGKFLEALTKLHNWIEQSTDIYKSTAVIEFEELFNTQHYPGLGYVKKLSIRHHIEMINAFFS